MSGSFPINIGVGKSMNIRFSVSSVAVAAGGVESIGVSLWPMGWGTPTNMDQRAGSINPPVRRSNQRVYVRKRIDAAQKVMRDYRRSTVPRS
jgi:hypothetical protein